MLQIASEAVMLVRFIAMSRRIMKRCPLDPKEQGDDQRLENDR